MGVGTSGQLRALLFTQACGVATAEIVMRCGPRPGRGPECVTCVRTLRRPGMRDAVRGCGVTTKAKPAPAGRGARLRRVVMRGLRPRDNTMSYMTYGPRSPRPHDTSDKNHTAGPRRTARRPRRATGQAGTARHAPSTETHRARSSCIIAFFCMGAYARRDKARPAGPRARDAARTSHGAAWTGRRLTGHTHRASPHRAMRTRPSWRDDE